MSENPISNVESENDHDSFEDAVESLSELNIKDQINKHGHGNLVINDGSDCEPQKRQGSESDSESDYDQDNAEPDTEDASTKPATVHHNIER